MFFLWIGGLFFMGYEIMAECLNSKFLDFNESATVATTDDVTESAAHIRLSEVSPLGPNVNPLE